MYVSLNLLFLEMVGGERGVTKMECECSVSCSSNFYALFCFISSSCTYSNYASFGVLVIHANINMLTKMHI